LRAFTGRIRYPQCLAFTNTACIILIITSTIKGIKWQRELSEEEEQFNQDESINVTRGGNQTVTIRNETMLEPFKLKIEYQIETYLVLGIPILIAVFFIILFLVFIVVMIFEYRRNHR